MRASCDASACGSTGNAIDEVDERGQPVAGDTLLVLLNAHHDLIEFTLPVEDPDERWERLMDTSDAEVPPDRLEGGTAIQPSGGRSHSSGWCRSYRESAIASRTWK